MTRRFLIFIVLLIILSAGSWAQDKPTPLSKPQPGIRTAVVPPPDSLVKSATQDSTTKSPRGLPQFELQQFVITGAASIDLPDVEKVEPDNLNRTVEWSDPLEAPRDRNTVEFASGQKEIYQGETRAVNDGRLQASVGTYLTSKFGLWLGTRSAESYLLGDVQYGVSRAYVPFANRSGGHAGVTGGMTLSAPSEWYDGGMLKGDLGYGSQTYRFYGYSTPSLARTFSRFDLSAEFDSRRDQVFDYSGSAGMLVSGINDSSSSVTETRFILGVGSDFLLGTLPVDSRIGLSLVSISGSGTGTLPFLEASVKTHKVWMGDLFLQGSLNFYLTQGMLDQKLARVYPQVEVGYRFLENTVISASYLGHVQLNTLTGLLGIHPYIAASSTIRQTDVPVDLLAFIETGWNESLRTRFSVRYHSMKDYPLFTEGGQKGLWTTAYFGTTNLTTFEADLFAKFAANSYFTLSLEANSSNNSVTNGKIPYVPDVQLKAGLSFEVLRGFRLLPTLSVTDHRVPDLLAAQKMNSYLLLGLRGEYSAFRALNIFIDFQNLTDTVYEEWNGYRATPFVVSAGIGFCW